MARDIFISYSSRSRPTADRVVAAIEQRGLTCWIAPRDIPLGQDFQTVIPTAIGQAAAVLVLVCEHANRSEEVARELGLARRDRKPIIPVRLDGCRLDGALAYQLTIAQWTDITTDFAAGIDALCKALHGLLHGPSPAPPPTVKARRRGHAGFFVVALILIIAGGAAAWFVLPAMHPAPVPAPIAEAALPAAPAPAAAPVAAPVSPPAASAAPVPLDQLRYFVETYYHMTALPSTRTLAFLATVLDESLKYSGQAMSRRDFLAVKQDYFARWPDRTYAVRPTSVTAVCNTNASICLVSGYVDYTLRAPSRRQQASGLEKFQFQIRSEAGTYRISQMTNVTVIRHMAVP